jgi:hypothetical protein
MAVPQCSGCRTPAPPPASKEVDAWTVTMRGEDGGPLILCFKCSSSERRTVAEAEARGQALFSLGDCTTDDLEWLAEDAERQDDQHAAWGKWSREREEHLDGGDA